MTLSKHRSGPARNPLYTLKQALRVLGITVPKSLRNCDIDRDLALHDARVVYHALMKHYHTDVGGDPERHLLLTLAYARVKDLCRPPRLPSSFLKPLKSSGAVLARYRRAWATRERHQKEREAVRRGEI